MIKIAHIINPVKVDKTSDLYIAQPIAFETIKKAKEFTNDSVNVDLFSTQFPEDVDFVPHFFRKTENLERSVLDLGTFKEKRKLPILKDILDRLYISSNADYFIHTNCDIALIPNFYISIAKIIEKGYDAFVINRRTIPDNYSKIEDIPLMYSEIGESHKGWDCFIYKRSLYKEFELGNVCVGIGGVGRIFVWNLVSKAKKFKEFKNCHLTFHIGNDRIWLKENYLDYKKHNRQEAHSILKKIAFKFNTIQKLEKLNYLGNFKIDWEINVQEKSVLPEETERYKFVFIAGLHKSGTTILVDSLKKHPDISGFSNTGVPKDEGQFLQSVFPPAMKFGGPGKFGFREEMHLTENSHLLTAENKEKIFQEWSQHWDITKPLLLEKSPPNILKTRFLQELFPNSYFIVITRHPIATSYATMKWSKTGIHSLLKHWITCHNIFEQDKKHLRDVYVLKFEDFIKDPDLILKKIYNFLGISYYKCSTKIQKSINNKYYEEWLKETKQKNWFRGKITHFKYRKLEKEINNFGYSLNKLEVI